MPMMTAMTTIMMTTMSTTTANHYLKLKPGSRTVTSKCCRADTSLLCLTLETSRKSLIPLPPAIGARHRPPARSEVQPRTPRRWRPLPCTYPLLSSFPLTDFGPFAA